MKLWGIVTFSLVLATAGAQAATAPDAVPVKDADGTTWAVVVTCSDCQSAADEELPHRCRAGMVQRPVVRQVFGRRERWSQISLPI